MLITSEELTEDIQDYATNLGVANQNLSKRLVNIKQVENLEQHITKYAWYSLDGNILPEPLLATQVRSKEASIGVTLEFAFNAPSISELYDSYLPKKLQIGEEEVTLQNIFQRATKTYLLGYLHDDYPNLSIIQKERHDIKDFVELAVQISNFCCDTKPD